MSYQKNDYAHEIDYRAELEAFDWHRADWRHDRLLAASPFREESRPSFYVYLEDTPTAKAGSWGDSGASDPDWTRGGFAKLLAYLRRETIEETLEYLADKYGGLHTIENAENPQSLRKIRLIGAEMPRILTESMLAPYRFRHPYLERRGISEAVQRLMGVGYCAEKGAITMPWRNSDESLGNVMYRKVDSKAFWYAEGGRRIGVMLYGINVIYSRNIKRASIVEAPICAMSLMTAGFPAVAIGGTAFTAEKRDLILRSPLDEIVIFADNDGAGRKLAGEISDELRGKIAVKIAEIPAPYKDVNDILRLEKAVNVSNYVERAKAVKPLVGVGLRGV